MKDSIFSRMTRAELRAEKRDLERIHDEVEAEVSTTIGRAKSRSDILLLIERQLADLRTFLP